MTHQKKFLKNLHQHLVEILHVHEINLQIIALTDSVTRFQ